MATTKRAEGSKSKRLSRRVAVETMTFARARQILAKDGFTRVVIVRRDEKNLRNIASILIHEAA